MSPACADSTGDALHPGEREDLADSRFRRDLPFGERAVEHGDFLAGREPAAADPADAEPPDVARIVERGDLELQRPVGIADRRRHVREDRFEQAAACRRPRAGVCAFATLTSSVAQPFSADA